MAKTHYLAAYDVSDDDLRNTTADLLKNAGMERIQYSVFYGELTRNEAEELAITFKEETLSHNAQLILLPLCESCSKKQIVTINEGDCPHDDPDEEKPEERKSSLNTGQNIERTGKNHKNTVNPGNQNEHKEDLLNNALPTEPEKSPHVQSKSRNIPPAIDAVNNGRESKSNDRTGKKEEKTQKKKQKEQKKRTTTNLDVLKEKRANRVLFF